MALICAPYVRLSGPPCSLDPPPETPGLKQAGCSEYRGIWGLLILTKNGIVLLLVLIVTYEAPHEKDVDSLFYGCMSLCR